MKTWKTIASILLLCCLTSCKDFQFDSSLSSDFARESSESVASSSSLSEVTIPHTISELEKNSEQYKPVVEIVSPQMGETLDRANIEVELKVTDLPLFQDDRLQLGNHLVLAIDSETLPPIYDLEQPIAIENLTPGTHTLRAFAVKPWGESFKTGNAYAQTTFNILTETNSNYPDSNLPLLTYNSPTGTYGAEPILLDFYLDYSKSSSGNNLNGLKDSSVKVTINGTSFTVKKWQPYYLTGFKPGENWVQLELIDKFGNSIENVFNNTVRVFNYDPQQQDTLSRLVTNKIPIVEAKSIVEQNYYIQPVKIPEIIKSIDDTQSETNTNSSETQNTVEQLPNKITPISDNNNIVEPEMAEKETPIIETLSPSAVDKNISQILSAKEEQAESLDRFEPEIEPNNLESAKNSVLPKYAGQKDLPVPSAAKETVVDKVTIEVIPQKIAPENIEASQLPLVKTDVSSLDSLPAAKFEVEQQTISEQTVKSFEDFTPETISPDVARKDEIAIPQPLLQSDSPELERKNKSLWWQKMLVGIRQKIESWAKKLPNEV